MWSFILIYRLNVSTTTLKRNVDANRLLRTRPTFSRSLLVSVAVSKLGCTELFFVEPGVKVNGEYYRNVLLMEKMLQAIWGCQATSSSSSRTAPHSTSSKGHHCVAATWNTKLHWTRSLASKLIRPQSSWIWGLIQEHVYQTAIRNIEELKECLIVVWAELKQSVIDKAIEQWRPRLRACVQAKGHHFEHLIKWNIFLFNIRLTYISWQTAS